MIGTLSECKNNLCEMILFCFVNLSRGQALLMDSGRASGLVIERQAVQTAVVLVIERQVVQTAVVLVVALRVERALACG